MFIGFDSGDGRSNLAVTANHKRGALNAHILPSIHALFLEHAKFFGHGLVLIRKQVKRKTEFLLKLFLG